MASDREGELEKIIHDLGRFSWYVAIVLAALFVIAAVVVAFFDVVHLDTPADRGWVTWLLGFLAVGSIVAGLAIPPLLRRMIPPVE